MFVKRIKIYEAKAHVLTKYATKNGKDMIKQSDHNVIECVFDIKVPNKTVNKRKEIYNLKNEENQNKFLQLTTSTLSLIHI